MDFCILSDTPIFEIKLLTCFFQNVQWSNSHVTVIHCVNFYNCSNFLFVIVCPKIELVRHKYKS